jgi:arylsulfatase A-like enzyme
MTQETRKSPPLSRRTLLAAAGAAMAAPMIVSSLARPARAQANAPGPAKAPASVARRSGLNIVYIFTDQERYHAKWPKGLSLPAHERLQRTGTSFANHFGASTMCTSSRSVMMTGLQTIDNKMFDNTDTPYIKSLSSDIPTIGKMLRASGYYAAYKGKWHLTQAFDTDQVERFFTKEMEENYGFSDFFSPGDLIGHTLGGYSYDNITAGSAINWLRTKGRTLSDDGKPWGLFISFVNPHDVMYFNTDAPGEKVQDNGRLMMHAARAPNHRLYKAEWDVPAPANLKQPFDAPGRPKAHGEFDKVWDGILGNIPLEESRWRRFQNYYINCIRNVDQQIDLVLRELDALSLAQNTIIVFTSDHGEMAGAHGLRGKGPFAYQETLHLPFHVVHPDVKGGQQCQAVTSHIDIVPTLLSMANVRQDRQAELAKRALPGKDISSLLSSPGNRPLNALREGALFTFSGLATVDSGVYAFAAKAAAAGKNPIEEAKRTGYKPDLKKRGAVRTVMDGRYKFSRYFSPMERNRPSNIDELYRNNDVELYDVAKDPHEMVNLGVDRVANRDLIVAMMNKLEALIKAEMGVDDGREMPDIANVHWGLGKIDL